MPAAGFVADLVTPAWSEFTGGSTARFFENPRSVEARELVADAALGVVDSIDLISPVNHEGAVFAVKLAPRRALAGER